MSTTHISDALRQLVADRAKDTCEYCLIPQLFGHAGTYHIDHIISEKHRGLSTLENLAYAFPSCNLRKGSDLATYLLELELIVPLYNPRKDVWPEHFSLEVNGLLISKTKSATGTIRFLDLNNRQVVTLRKSLIRGGLTLSL